MNRLSKAMNQVALHNHFTEPPRKSCPLVRAVASNLHRSTLGLPWILWLNVNASTLMIPAHSYGMVDTRQNLTMS